MEIRLWEYGKDDDKITSFLKSASLAHKIPQKSEEWFHWKFEGSPYGKTILACAFDGNEVVGCVGIGFGQMTYGDKSLSCALSYETFVHPDYQGCHLFTKLTKLAEEECVNQGVDVLYNFPNRNSLPGFIKRGWTKIRLSSYKIKLCKPFKCLMKFKEMRKGFVSCDSNLENIKNTDIIDCGRFSQDGIFIPQWSKKYLEWRFLTHPVGHYWIYNENDVIAIFRIGYKGTLKQAELLHIHRVHGKLSKKEWRNIYNKLRLETDIDFIGISASKDHPITKLLSWCYIKVPSRGNFTYKILANDISIDSFRMAKCDIDAHTY